MTTARLDLWKIRLYYFLWVGGAGFLLPFINLFFTDRGLSGTEIGLLGTLGSVAALIAAPVWGRVSDAATRPRRLVQFGLLESALAMLVLSQQTIFAWMAVIIALDSLLSAGVFPLSDALALSIARGGGTGFGSVRLWGSLGWAVAALVGGWLIERTGLFAMFAGYVLCGLTGIVIVGLIRTDLRRGTAGAREPGASVRRVLRDVLKDRSLIGLAIALSVVWFATIGYHQFEPVYLDQLGAGETLIGLASTLGALVELPAMLWADRLTRHHGAERLLRFSFVLDVLRLAGILIAPSVAAILVSRAIGGVAYSFYVIALTEFVGEHAPNRQVATMLALFTVTLPGLVRMVAAPASGWVFDRVGAYWLYAIALGGTAIAWVVMRLTAARKT